jgi:hypothetical protein
MATNTPDGDAALCPPHSGFHVYAHLPLDVTDDTMTTLGVRVGDLHFHYHAKMIHQHPRPIGHDNASPPTTAYPVFPTWGFLHLEWSDAAAMAKVAARMMGVSAQSVRTLPGTHLVARLLHASFPSEILTDDTYRGYFWDGHVERVLEDGPNTEPPCMEYALIERVEAADLARHMATTLGITDKDSAPSGARDLLDMLLHAAAPGLLYQRSQHDRMVWEHTLKRILVDGRDALPDALRADR